jgi:hypothetical protein
LRIRRSGESPKRQGNGYDIDLEQFFRPRRIEPLKSPQNSLLFVRNPRPKDRLPALAVVAEGPYKTLMLRQAPRKKQPS